MGAKKQYRCGVIGYGGAFNMGRQHLSSLDDKDGVEAVAVCDMDAGRREIAAADWPGIKVYSRVGDMLKYADLDLAVVVTPHNTHGPLALQCLRAGVGVICEKPMAVSSNEIKAMMQEARKRKLLLSTFHNRRWDGDFMVLRDLIQKEKRIGRVFRIEAGLSSYGPQGSWWRSDRKISGGSIYDWGAHFTDWILNLVAEPIDWVSGYQVKNHGWKGYTNEDHSEYTVCFKGGCRATLTISNLSMSRRSRWRILGEEGAIEESDGKFRVESMVQGRRMHADVDYLESSGHKYYENVHAHLLGKEDLVITAESAARVIGVLEAANISAARRGAPVKPAFV
jgi:scyllo-inositol 2-dehydrogenase (NADP+)